MKISGLVIKFSLCAFLLMFVFSCERPRGCTDPYATNYDVNARVDNGTCKYGVTFYFDQNGANATVNIANQSALITGNYQTGTPNCGTGAQGCANFSLPVGTYTYSASSTTTLWNGTVTVDGSGCQEVVLPQSTGSVVFFTQSNSFGNITVNINGGSGVITSYITNNVAPYCGFSGCATFDLAPGTYSYTATGSGASWNGNVTITTDGCQPVQLQ